MLAEAMVIARAANARAQLLGLQPEFDAWRVSDLPIVDRPSRPPLFVSLPGLSRMRSRSDRECFNIICDAVYYFRDAICKHVLSNIPDTVKRLELAEALVIAEAEEFREGMPSDLDELPYDELTPLQRIAQDIKARLYGVDSLIDMGGLAR
jgi:hypothetical protein